MGLQQRNILSKYIISKCDTDGPTLMTRIKNAIIKNETDT